MPHQLPGLLNNILKPIILEVSLAVGGILALLLVGWMSPAEAQQIPLGGGTVPQFVEQLPFIPVVDGTLNTQVTLSMCEFQAKVLPTGTLVKGIAPSTWVWGYVSGATCPSTVQDTYIGPIVLAKRNIPTEIKYVNQLPNTSASSLLAYKNGTDQTLHWADAGNNGVNLCAHSVVTGAVPTGTCAQHYAGNIPAVVHLHGGEVPPELDGGPDAWFTSTGSIVGPSYYSKDGSTPKNYAIYRYPNSQEAAPLWFHDHTLGVTRLNVYAGLAGGYLITDPATDPQNLPVGRPLPGTPSPGTEPLIPFVIQDRMFDTTGNLFFPNAGINPEHPFWVPEFVGDVIVVNGKAWPKVNVQPKRYRILFLNGSNARTYTMSLGPHLPMWQIGTDQGYLNTPVMVNSLTLMPGERADVIIDFGSMKPGTKVVLSNSAKTPYPGGTSATGSTTANIALFTINACTGGVCPLDTSFNPATVGASLRTSTNPLVNLASTITTSTPVRRLTLNEIISPPLTIGGVKYPGGPSEILVNNTTYSGVTSPVRSDFQNVTKSSNTVSESEYFSELPQEGATEIWEIINLTADAHPIHLHLSPVQLVSRQTFDVKKYTASYNAAFPCTGAGCVGVYRPASGPPLAYAGPATDPITQGDPHKCSLPNAICGGNPAVNPFLNGAAMAPQPNEVGWKDVIMALPGQVTRIAVRWAPTNSPNLYYAFNPNDDGHGYVWHCHIIDHEDNEMMRPDLQMQSLSASRSYVQGADY